MKSKTIIFIFSLVLMIPLGCSSRNNTAEELPQGVHKFRLSEHINTTNYTYLHADENGKKYWLAVPRMEAKDGDTYYYKGGMVMVNFHSNELNRDFATVLFVEKVTTDPAQLEVTDIPATTHSAMVRKSGPLKIRITPPQGGISLADLLANKEKYAGKTVLIRGQVTKVNRHIMGKNWVHLQDGTQFNGVYDLTATSTSDFKEGETVTLRGKIVLNKDFGYGYKYDILMEEAVPVP